MTKSTQTVLLALLQEPAAWVYGLEIIDRTGLSSGTIYPLLRRLLDDGLLEAKPETHSASQLGRPTRMHYRLSGTGVSVAKAQAAELARLTGGRLRWLGA